MDLRIITSTGKNDNDYISLTDMLKAKDGDFFISDWLRNRNTIEFIGIWEQIYNPDFNYGEFAIIKSQAGLNSYKIRVKEWVHSVLYLRCYINPRYQRMGIGIGKRDIKGIAKYKTIFLKEFLPR